MFIDISKADKAAVLAALYNASRAQGMGVFREVAGPMTVEQAREAMTTHETSVETLSYCASITYMGAR